MLYEQRQCLPLVWTIISRMWTIDTVFPKKANSKLFTVDENKDNISLGENSGKLTACDGSFYMSN